VVKEFPSGSGDWLDFIIENRTGKAKTHKYDVIIGEMADDAVYDSIDLYVRKYISKQELLRRIRIAKRNQQVCISTESALANLIFIKEHRI